MTHGMYHLTQGVHKHQDVWKPSTSQGMWSGHIVWEHDTTLYILVWNNILTIQFWFFGGNFSRRSWDRNRSNPFGCRWNLHCVIYIFIIFFLYTADDRHKKNALKKILDPSIIMILKRQSEGYKGSIISNSSLEKVGRKLRDIGVCKSSQLHYMIFRFFFINLRYTP